MNSLASLDLRPTLLKGLAESEDEEREEKPVLILSSVFSLRREPALWGPAGAGPKEPALWGAAGAGPFRGTV